MARLVMSSPGTFRLQERETEMTGAIECAGVAMLHPQTQHLAAYFGVLHLRR